MKDRFLNLSFSDRPVSCPLSPEMEEPIRTQFKRLPPDCAEWSFTDEPLHPLTERIETLSDLWK